MKNFSGIYAGTIEQRLKDNGFEVYHYDDEKDFIFVSRYGEGKYVTVTSDYETVIVYTTDLNEEDFIKNITSAETDYGDRLNYSFKDLNIFQVLGFDETNGF